MKYKCAVCKHEFESYDTYEYRGEYACGDHFDEMIEIRDRQRNQIINEEHNKTKVFNGLDMTDSVIGKANNKLLSRQKEIASKETNKLKEYEGRD